jgi:hypothetical protein
MKSSLTQIMEKRDNEPHLKPGAGGYSSSVKNKKLPRSGLLSFSSKRGYYNLNGSLFGMVYFE